MAAESSRGGRSSARRTDTPGSRTAARPARRATRPRTRGPAQETGKPESTRSEAPLLPAGLRRGLGLTQRAFVLVVVLIVLLVRYMPTLRVYFNQQYQIAQTKEQIRAHEKAIDTLEDEIARWEDPEYVKIQARERLGWVLPGETGFRVIGPDGQPYGGGQQIGVGRLPEDEQQAAWWDRIWGSVRAADDPAGDDRPASGSPAQPSAMPSASPTR